MSSFLYSIQENYNNMLKISVFNFFKTGNPAFDAIISTTVITFAGYFINFVYRCAPSFKTDADDIINLFYKKNSVIVEGKKYFTANCYGTSSTTSSYSDRFKAFNAYIINNINGNNTIYKIKEFHTNFQSSCEGIDRKKISDIFMVIQNKPFKIKDNIYVLSSVEQEEFKDDKEKSNIRTDKITIQIYSRVYSVEYLTNFLDEITQEYLSKIKDYRHNKKFIFKLHKVKFDSDNESKLDCWREDLFESAKNFNNIFFDGKRQLVEKIDFFINNRSWYYEKGIPYTLGIGLYGPPGTGKTSFIKALANYTNRHIIEISLKLIKTKGQLEQFFFENTYNGNNEKNTITFDKKIIVFEDIDCIGDIILDRTKSKSRDEPKKSRRAIGNQMRDVVNAIREIKEPMTNVVGVSNNIDVNNEAPITLDDILNLWDGIRETPGRILIISSNHYNKLDPALIRPGRIDITHEFSKASHNTISEMYFHLFNKNIDNVALKKVKEYFYSPAELINIYDANKTGNEFTKRLTMNKKMN